MVNKSLKVLNDEGARRAFARHDRVWQQNRYVYPVVSRRSKGISIGVNLNPDKVCNFDCVYCCVDRKVALPAWGGGREVDVGILRAELEAMLEVVRSGEIYTFDPFDGIPAELRRVNDVAFSGDGEPTTCPQFAEAVRAAAEVVKGKTQNAKRKTKDEGGVDSAGIKLVLITNATMFHKPAVREVLAFLDGHNGEIWAKLDAGTAEYYQEIDRTGVPFERVLKNVTWCCQTRATVIQTLLMKVRGVGPSEAEVEAYVGRLRDIVAAVEETDAATRGRGDAATKGIKLVQLYTVARGTTEAYVTALSAEALAKIAGRVRTLNVPVEVYP